MSDICKRLLPICLLIALACGLFPALAFADGEDRTAPVVTNVTVANEGDSVAKGDKLLLDVTLVEEGASATGVSIVTVGLSPDEGAGQVQKVFTYGGSDPSGSQALFSGTHRFEIDIPEDVVSGGWHVSEVSLQDQNNNLTGLYDLLPQQGDTWYFSTSGKYTTIPIPAFEITGEGGDTTAPVLSSVSVKNDNAEVAKPGNLKLQLGVVEEGKGVSEVYVSLAKNDGTSSVSHWFVSGTSAGTSGNFTYFEGAWATGTYVIEVPINNACRTGEWAVTNISIKDSAGNKTKYQLLDGQDKYDGTSITAPTFKVTGEDDETGVPELASLTVMNEGAVVNKPGILNMKLSLSEASSSVTSGEVWLIADDSANSMYDAIGRFEFSEQKDNYYVAYLDAPIAPGASATIPLRIDADARVGSWHVSVVTLWDAAGNSSTYSEKLENGPLVFEEQGIEIPTFTVADEFEYAAHTTLSSPYLLETVEGLKDGQAARVLIDGDGKLPKEVLDAIAGHDRTIVAYHGDGYQWVIDGSAIDPEKTKDVFLFIKMGKVEGGSFPDDQAASLEFADNGVLPGTMKVRFKNDYLYNAGTKGPLHLYYMKDGSYSEEDTTFDFFFDGSDNWCSMDITHNSTFVVSPKKLDSESGGKAKKMHRLYNPNSYEHFYTGDDAEFANLVSLGWQDEQYGWTAPATGDPVYRLYNPNNGGDHHYTLDPDERDMLIAAGWQDEKIGWYSDPNKTVTVYREYNPNELARNHNYTADKAEHDYLVSLGWRDEKIAWYGV